MSLPSFEADHVFGRLDGAVALVTGAGTGLGLLAARALASNGATVFITGRREDKLVEAVEVHGQGLRGKFVPLQLDVTDADSLKKVAAEVQSKEGKLHILINNAGMIGPLTFLLGGGGGDDNPSSQLSYSEKHLSNESFSQWDDTLRLNTSSVFFSTMTFLPLLEAGLKAPFRAGFSPTVINLSSVNSLIKKNNAAVSCYAYSATKAAVNHLTRTLAHDLNYGHKVVGPPGIRVNAICPGVFASEMTGKPSQRGGVTPAEDVDVQPVNGRLGTPEEFASAILFMANNTFLQGQVVVLCGGWTSIDPCTV
ncbi:hypothetical protein OC834_005044 [Tilletia horrida]|nr:hypothetical protein OC834_005044 [Tilletia horrida]